MAKSRLNQIIAVHNSKKAAAERLLTDAHHSWDATKLTGLSRSYQSTVEGGEQLPPESRSVQLRVTEHMRQVMEKVEDWINLAATLESGNLIAAADIIVDEKVLCPKVPVTILLFIEKRLEQLHTFCSKLPVLPADKDWHEDENRNCFVTMTEKQARKLKVPKTHVKFEPTAEHPGQADIIQVEEVYGYWTIVHMSGAIPEKDRQVLVEKVEKLRDAVKRAREEANSIVVEDKIIGKQIIDWIFGESR